MKQMHATHSTVSMSACHHSSNLISSIHLRMKQGLENNGYFQS